MKILIMRHAEPYYPTDTLTAKGRLEAAALAEMVAKWDITKFYVSPLGRAKLTCQYTLDKMGCQAETMEWLREFSPKIDKPHPGNHVPWDWRPSGWEDHDDFYTVEKRATSGKNMTGSARSLTSSWQSTAMCGKAGITGPSAPITIPSHFIAISAWSAYC